MEPTIQENGGDSSGFITSSKGITLSIVSLCTWAFTQILYKMTSIILGKNVSYEAFCLFVSLGISLLGGYYIVKQLYNKKDKLRNFAMGLNILLIYSSANGIQAGIAASSTGYTQSTNGTTGKITVMPVQSALFGLIDTRPWLPDLTSKIAITELKTANNSLQFKLDSVISKKTEATSQPSVDIDKLRFYLIDSIRGALNLSNNENPNIEAYEQLRNRWLQKEETDPDFRGSMYKFRDFMRKWMGQGYLDSLLHYPLK